MGQLWSRDKSLESPLVNAIPEDAGQAERKLPFDPRSVSDDVSRTPIQIKEDDDDDEPTPGSGAKLLLSDSGVDEVRATCDTPTSAEILLQKKLKSLSLDPRSPSGIPRTPIVVEEENSAKTETNPKRGAVATNVPATKLEFEESTELEKSTPVQDEEVQVLSEDRASDIEVDDADEKDEGNNLTEKSLESSLEEGEIRSSSEDEEENEEPELNLRPQKPLISPLKTTVPCETGSATTPNRVPLGDVENKDTSLII